MARPVVLSVEDKFRLVCSVSSGEMTILEAARRSEVSEQSQSRDPLVDRDELADQLVLVDAVTQDALLQKVDLVDDRVELAAVT
jgi:hypothetical protein